MSQIIIIFAGQRCKQEFDKRHVIRVCKQQDGRQLRPFLRLHVAKVHFIQWQQLKRFCSLTTTTAAAATTTATESTVKCHGHEVRSATTTAAAATTTTAAATASK